MPRLIRPGITDTFMVPGRFTSAGGCAPAGRFGTRARFGVTGGLAAGALVLAGLAATGPALATSQTGQSLSASRVPVAGTRPAWAVTANRTGLATLRMAPSGRGSTWHRATRQAWRLAAAVSTPGNARYRHFLSAAQISARFGQSAARVGMLAGWLKQSGLRVTAISNHVADGYIAVSGSLASASRAFDVTFASYRLAGQGIVRAPEQAASVPAEFASAVLSISGLDTARADMRPRALPPPGPNYWIARPCNSYYHQKTATGMPAAYGKHWPWALCGYKPSQVRAVYGVTASGMTGAGQTVAIVDAYASPTMLRDANAYASAVGDQPFAPGQYQQFRPARFTQAGNNQCGAQGWYGEQTLDVESVHGMAPGANVRFVAAASCQDPDLADALAYIVDNRLASIVSNSWGDTEAGAAEFVSVYHLIFQAGAAEGIDFLFSSGDNGYEAPGEDPGFSAHTQVDYPTSDPWVTSVGGTSLAIGRGNSYQFETSWGTLLDPLASNGRTWHLTPPGGYPYWFDGASGGGTSTLYSQPWYQQGVVPASLSERLPSGAHSAAPMRELPDVSAYADPATGFLVGETVLKPSGHGYEFAFSRIGGTSVSCPTFAGIEADAQQSAGGPLGFANPAIYDRYGTSAFHDVTDHPLGPGFLAQIRANYANGGVAPGGPLQYFLRTLGIDGEGAARLNATPGYDDATGVGSPAGYITSFARFGP